MKPMQKKPRPSGWARLLSGTVLGASGAALAWVWLSAGGRWGLSAWPLGLAGGAALLGLLVGARYFKTWPLALRAALSSAAMGGLLYAFDALLLRPGVEILAFSAYGKEIEVLAPRWLGLACLAPYFWLVDGFTLADFPWYQRAASALWRGLIIACLAASLTKAQAITKTEHVCTVVMIDVSDSVPDAALAKARDYLAQTIEARRDGDLVRLVTFATRAKAIDLTEETLALRGEALRAALPAIERPPKPSQADALGEGEASDLQAALRLAYGLYPPGYIKRAVMISDGNQTAGDLLGEAYQAAEQGIKLSTKSFPEAYPDEVLITSVSAPERVQQGAPFDLKVEIYASKAQDVRLKMCKDGFCDPTDVQTVTVKPGFTEAVFPKQKVSSGSFAKFTVDLTPKGPDTIADNNRAAEAVLVRSKPHVLYLEGELGYSSYLREALMAQEIDVEVRGPNEVPTSLAELSAFDAVILSDIDATFVDATQMDLLETYVRSLGGGLILTGGDRSFGLGGYYRTTIEKIAPVDFESDREKETPSVAIALVVDKSGSMDGAKIEIVKEAARAVVELLSPSDKISVIGFDSAAVSIVSMQPARNRIKISSDIARLTAGGGTNIFPALDKAYAELNGVKAKIKHVILLTDGQAPTEGLLQLATAMSFDKITLSTVGVAEADRTLLEQLAQIGGGRSYFTRDAENIPKIFTKETTAATRSAVVEGAFLAVPTAKGQGSQALKGIDWSVAPPLLGYIATKPKPRAEVLLLSDAGEVLLARMSVGVGKTVAFTSDVKSRWSPEWIRWSSYGTFWAQVVRDTMRHRTQERFELRADAQGNTLRAQIDAVDEDEEYVNGLESELSVFDPEKPGQKRNFPLYQVAAGRYEGDFVLPGYGSFVIEATHKKDGQVIGQSRATVSQPYPREHFISERDAVLLQKAATLTGGTPDAAPGALFASLGESVKGSEPLWPYAVLAALALFVLDVFLRRVRLGRV